MNTASSLPVVVFCHPSNLTIARMASISATIRSTITGVLSFLTPLNNSVKAALPRSISSSGTTSFSALAVSHVTPPAFHPVS